MNKPIALCAALLLLLGVQAAQAQRKLNDRRAALPAGFVRIFMLSGQVNVIGWDRDSLVVTGIVHETSQEKFMIGTTAQGAKLGIWSEHEAALQPANITVYVPARSQVWVKTTSATVNVSNVAGGVDVFSVSGNVTVSGAPRALYAETMGGAINSSVSSASARLKTASGAIKSSGSVADLAAISVSGDIHAAPARFGRARFESVDGHIRYYGAVPAASVMEVINHAGAITLVIPARTVADFAFNLYEAELEDEFGIRKRWMLSEGYKAREMTFGLGDGPAARITISSFKGPVYIRRLEGAK